MVEQLKDPVFWELFWNNGGRFLLNLIVVIYLLLTGIMIYGHVKNRRDRSKVSTSNKRWINQTTRRRSLFDGMETLETHTKRVPSRPDFSGARHVSTHKGVPVNVGHEFTGSDRIVYDTNKGTIKPVRLNKDELSETTDSKGTLSYPSTEVFVK